MASSASTVSLQKSIDQRRTSCETVCSSNSSCILQKRKQINPLARPLRTTVSRSNGNAVRQRVLSAKLSRVRSLQNQLNDANFHLMELAKENRALKTLQKRQDKALAKYEDQNADLPRLLKSHEEEIRTLNERSKALRRNIKELTDQNKTKDEEIASLREQLKKVLELSKDKRLGEREKLQNQVQDLQEKLKASEEQINLLNRKLLLETKNMKYRMNQEMSKNKLNQKELEQAYKEIDRLNNLIDKKERQIASGNKHFQQRQAVSMVSLTGSGGDFKANSSLQLTGEEKEIESGSGSSVKLESISPRKDEVEEEAEKVIKSILKPPTESIKERLSANGSKTDLSKFASSSPADSNKERPFNKMKTKDNNTSMINKSQSEKSIYTITRKRNRPSSSHKLEKLNSSVQNIIQKTDSNDIIGKQLGDCCNDVMSKINECNRVINRHQEDFEQAKTETEKLLQALRENDKLDSELRLQSMLDKDVFELPDKDKELAEMILNEEYYFQKTTSVDTVDKPVDKNGNVVEKTIKQEDKKKLLATLEAIDKGEEVEVAHENAMESSLRKTKLMKELFGDIET